MLQQSNSILRLCIVVVVVMLLQLTPVLSQDVKIGTQTWTSKNLDVSTFRNGDPIPEAKSKEEWHKAGENKQPAWCYYDNDDQNGKKYGKLYNWYAVNDSRGLAPKGYHIPSDAEWTVLTDKLGGKYKAGDKMKSKTGWAFKGNGKNSSGFNGLPGGSRFSTDAGIENYFYDIEKAVYWWSSTVEGIFGSWYLYINYRYGMTIRTYETAKNGCSVRCIKD